MSSLIRLAIRVYQKFGSALLGSNCRFQPSCSQYTFEAVNRHGSVKGMWMGLGRLSRCHPFHPGGFDPVPEADDD